ncbi:MAG: hypothetical protein HC803_04790 [Saprospiraceae bacterium]|nr:hypothetical protein [Saprospiraceae bacterium]
MWNYRYNEAQTQKQKQKSPKGATSITSGNARCWATNEELEIIAVTQKQKQKTKKPQRGNILSIGQRLM